MSPDPYKCPQDSAKAGPGVSVCSDAMSANLPGHSASDSTDGSSTVLLTVIDGTPPLNMTKPDSISLYSDGATPNTAWGNVRLGTTAVTLNPTRHDSWVLFEACDGHVKMLRPERVSSGRDNASPAGPQDGVHAAGANALGSSYTLTFSEK